MGTRITRGQRRRLGIVVILATLATSVTFYGQYGDDV